MNYKYLFYHDVGEISDLSQSEEPNLVMWRVKVMVSRDKLCTPPSSSVQIVP